MMPFFLTQRDTGFFDKKAEKDSLLDILPPHRLVRDLDDAQSDSVWTHVALILDGITGGSGWVERANLAEATEAQVPRVVLSEDTFVAECVSRAWTANLLKDIAPFYVDADYLIALASIQSGLTNPVGLGPKGVRVGPFGVTADEWKAFTKVKFDDYTYKDYEIDLPLFQVAGAAYQMHEDAKALSALWEKEGVGSPEEPYLPRFGELLRCRLIGVDATFAMQVKLKNNDASQMLPDFLKDQGLSAAKANELMTDRRQFMRAGQTETGDPFSLQVFSEKCTEILNKALEDAFALISKHVPEAVQRTTGPAPWMKFAQQELDAKINESTAAGRKKIAKYFQSTGFKQGTADDKWCAAFVAWCMDQCGKPVSDSFNAFRNTAAASASWREWGNVEVSQKADPPVGAVVVLSPSKNTDAISHVGFFKQYQDGKRRVTILGGNQSNEVNETNFPATDVVEIRWLQTEASVDGGPVDNKPVAGAAVPGATGHDVLILARTIFGEARSLKTQGRQAVASVMINRTKKRFRGKTSIAEVCLDPKQFSCWNIGDPNRAQIIDKVPGSNVTFDECFEVATQAVKGGFPDVTQGALHYFAKSMKTPPSWVTNSPDRRMTFEDEGHFFFTGIR